MQTSSPARLLRLPSVLERIPFSKSEIYRRIKAGTFPAPVRCGLHSIAFLESDIDQYIQKLAQESGK